MRKDWDLNPGSRTGVGLIFGELVQVHSMALPRHQQSACSKAFQRILIDHLRAPETLTTVFFPGVLKPQPSL